MESWESEAHLFLICVCVGGGAGFRSWVLCKSNQCVLGHWAISAAPFYVSWSTSLRNPPASTSSALGFQVCIAALVFLHGCWETGEIAQWLRVGERVLIRSPCLLNKHFTDWTISPAPPRLWIYCKILKDITVRKRDRVVPQGLLLLCLLLSFWERDWLD